MLILEPFVYYATVSAPQIRTDQSDEVGHSIGVRVTMVDRLLFVVEGSGRRCRLQFTSFEHDGRSTAIAAKERRRGSPQGQTRFENTATFSRRSHTWLAGTAESQTTREGERSSHDHSSIRMSMPECRRRSERARISPIDLSRRKTRSLNRCKTSNARKRTARQHFNAPSARTAHAYAGKWQRVRTNVFTLHNSTG